MTEEERIEGNKLIARFMDVKVQKWVDSRDNVFVGLYITDEEGSFDWDSGIDWFQPHHDWNQLMAVVEKISTIQYTHISWTDSLPYEDYAYPRTFGMRDENGQYMVRFNAQPLFTAPTLIEACYQAVVYFIENQEEK